MSNTADFINPPEEVSGQDLDGFFDAPLYQEATPAIPEIGFDHGGGRCFGRRAPGTRELKAAESTPSWDSK